jgi:hypothetical protein
MVADADADADADAGASCDLFDRRVRALLSERLLSRLDKRSRRAASRRSWRSAVSPGFAC